MSKPRGFAAMSPERRREVAAAGGRAAQKSPNIHRWSADEARDHAAEGGEAVSQDARHMAEIGREGGKASARRRKDQRES